MKRTTRLSKRVLSLILSLCMMISLLPAVAIGAGARDTTKLTLTADSSNPTALYARHKGGYELKYAVGQVTGSATAGTFKVVLKKVEVENGAESDISDNDSTVSATIDDSSTFDDSSTLTVKVEITELAVAGTYHLRVVPVMTSESTLEASADVTITIAKTPVTVEGISLNGVTDGKAVYGTTVSYTGTATVRTTGSDAKEVDSAVTYTWQQTTDGTTYTDCAQNAVPTAIGKYQLVVSVNTNSYTTGDNPLKLPFEITGIPVTITSAKVTGANDSNQVIWTGNPVTLDRNSVSVVKTSGGSAVSDASPTVSWYDSHNEQLSTAPSDSGTYSMVVSATGNYVGSQDFDLTIEKAAAPTVTNPTGYTLNSGESKTDINLSGCYTAPAGMADIYYAVTTQDSDLLTATVTSAGVLTITAKSVTEVKNTNVVVTVSSKNHANFTITVPVTINPTPGVTLTVGTVTGGTVKDSVVTGTYGTAMSIPLTASNNFNGAATGYTFSYATKSGETYTKSTALPTGMGISSSGATATVTTTKDTPVGTYYVLAENSGKQAVITIKVENADYTGTKAVSQVVAPNVATTTVNVKLPDLPAGAKYSETITDWTVSDDKGLIDTKSLKLSEETTSDGKSVKVILGTTAQPGGTTATITIPVTGATDYKDYSVVITVTAASSGITVATSADAKTIVYGGDDVKYSIVDTTDYTGLASGSTVKYKIVNLSSSLTSAAATTAVSKSEGFTIALSSTIGTDASAKTVYANAGDYTFQVQAIEVKSDGKTEILGISDPQTLTIGKADLKVENIALTAKVRAADSQNVKLPDLSAYASDVTGVENPAYGTPKIETGNNSANLIKTPLNAIETVKATETTSAYQQLTVVTQSAAAKSKGIITIPVTGGTNYKDTNLTITIIASDDTVTLSGVSVAAKDGETEAMTGNTKVYDGEPVVYIGTPTATTIADEKTVSTTDIPATDYVYTWQVKNANGEYEDITNNAAPVNVGEYKLIVSVKDSNTKYAGSQEITFSITSKPITIRPADMTAEVGGNIPTLTLDVSGVVAADRSANFLKYVSEASFKLYLADDENKTEVTSLTEAGKYTIQWIGKSTFEGAVYDILTNYTVAYESYGTLTATVPVRTITVNATENGTVTADKANAPKGDTVTLTVTPAEGYQQSSLTVATASNAAVEVTETEGKLTFVMPGEDVTISASFKKIPGEADPGETKPAETTPVVTPTPVYYFSDLDQTSWAKDYIQAVYEAGLMNGKNAELKTFEPKTVTTRAELIVVLYRMAGSPAVHGDNSFIDVYATWNKDAITWAASAGLVKGYGDGTFGPNDSVTREQMVTFLYRFAQYCGEDISARSNLSKFPDASSVSWWAEDAMSWAVSSGIITGTVINGRTYLDPAGNTLREQLAAILYRYYLTPATSDDTTNNTVTTPEVPTAPDTSDSSAVTTPDNSGSSETTVPDNSGSTVTPVVPTVPDNSDQTESTEDPTISPDNTGSNETAPATPPEGEIDEH